MGDAFVRQFRVAGFYRVKIASITKIERGQLVRYLSLQKSKIEIHNLLLYVVVKTWIFFCLYGAIKNSCHKLRLFVCVSAFGLGVRKRDSGNEPLSVTIILLE